MKNKICYKRVLMLVENSGYPEDVRVLHEAMTLIEAGYLVSVICPSSSNRPWREILEGVNVLRYPNLIWGKGFVTYMMEYGYSLLVMFLLSILVLWKPGFEIIHAANPPDTAFIIAIFYKLFRKKFIFDQHDLSPEIYRLRFKTNKNVHGLIYKTLLALEKLSCCIADHIIAPNESYKIYEMNRYGVLPERITVVRNGPDLQTPGSSPYIEEIRKDGKKTLLYLGVIGYQDSVDYLLRALYNLKYKLGRKDFLCVIVGDGNALPSLKSQAVMLGLHEFIIFTGWIESKNVYGYINSSDICIAPEPSNGLNDRSTIIKIMEYMSSGKPTVAFDLPENRITAQSAAIYATPNDEMDFAEKIVMLMDDPPRCREMGKIARKRIEKELCWPLQKVHLLDAYYKVQGNDGFKVRLEHVEN